MYIVSVYNSTIGVKLKKWNMAIFKIKSKTEIKKLK